MKHQTQKHPTSGTRQSGMTLIELAVVLLILVGLAGLLIPYVSSFVGKTHSSTGGSTIANLNMAINRFGNESFGQGDHPDDLDSLIYDDAGTDTVVGIANPAQYNIEALTPESLASLNELGIATLVDQDPTAFTFGPNAGQRVLADTIEIVTLSAAGLANLNVAIGTDTTTGAYAVFGVGISSELNNRTMSDAPVHFHAGAADYDTLYSRYLAVYRIPSADNTLANATGARAKFLGTVAPMNPIQGAGQHIQEYRDIVQAENS